MADSGETQPPVDGRVARRQRNIDNVLDVVLQMFAEESLFPTIEQVSQRSGLSLRSLYRYFADPAELLEAVIKRNRDENDKIAHLATIGQGPLPRRVDDFVAMRLRLYDHVGPVFRATVANAPRHQRVRDELGVTRTRLRKQFELHFDPELASRNGKDREMVLAAGDVLTQLDSIDLLRRHRRLSVTASKQVLCHGLTAILS